MTPSRLSACRSLELRGETRGRRPEAVPVTLTSPGGMDGSGPPSAGKRKVFRKDLRRVTVGAAGAEKANKTPAE